MKESKGRKRLPRIPSGHAGITADTNQESVSLGFRVTKQPYEQKEFMESDDETGVEFLRAAENGDRQFFVEYINQGGDVNFQDPMTGQTALHVAAGTSDKFQIRALVNSGRCNFLIRDRQGKLASEIAFEHSPFPEIARYLNILEKDQHEVQRSFGEMEPRR